MKSSQIFKSSIRSAMALAVAASATASDFVQPFHLAAPDSNPAAVLRYGEPGGTPPAPAKPASLAAPAPAPALAPVPASAPASVPVTPIAPVAGVRGSDVFSSEAPIDPAPKPTKKKRTKTPPATPEPLEDGTSSDLKDPNSIRGEAAEVRERAILMEKDAQRMALQIEREVAKAAEDARRGAKMEKRIKVTSTGSRRARTLLVPGDTQTVEERNQLNEDLTVMHRIVSKATGKRRESEPFHIAFDRPDAPEMDALYLDGYGALFMVSVNFPLVEPEKPKVKEPEDDGKDPVWEETRRRVKASAEVVGNADDSPDAFGMSSGGGGAGGGMSVVQDVVLWTAETEPFDKERVEGLKRKLKTSLKHASNIRGLRPEDTVAVVVTGASTLSGPVTKSYRGGVDPLAIQHFALGGGSMNSGDVGRSRMVLRAKKSDIDAFAAGKTDLEQFPVKITVGR